MKKVVTIVDMKYEGCARNVQEKYSSVEGVESVKIDLENDTDVIESQSEINKDTLDTALAKTNYTVAY